MRNHELETILYFQVFHNQALIMEKLNILIPETTKKEAECWEANNAK